MSQNDDTISRKKAIDAVNTMPSFLDPYGEEMISKYGAKIRLEFLESVKPERKTGRWLELTNTNHTYVCSVCGRMLVNITDGKNMVTKNYPFCHCGADMRGGQDGNK